MSNNNLIVLKDYTWLANQVFAGRVHSFVMNEFNKLIVNKTKNLKLSDLASLSEKILKEKDCTSTFLGLYGFPSPICASVNKIVVHGVANDYILKDGDVLSIDLGVTYNGAIADSAYTWIFGNPRSDREVELVNAGKEALYLAIDQVKVGNRIGAIGNVINSCGKKHNLGIITDYGGHGIDNNKLHANPFIANFGSNNDGPIILPGFSIAIEPMFILGGTSLKKLDDGFSLEAEGISCHFEHSVSISPNGDLVIITENGL